MINLKKLIIQLTIFMAFSSFALCDDEQNNKDKLIYLINAGEYIKAQKFLNEKKVGFDEIILQKSYIYLGKKFFSNRQFIEALNCYINVPDKKNKISGKIRKLGQLIGGKFFKKRDYKKALKYYKFSRDQKIIDKLDRINKGEEKLLSGNYKDALTIFVKFDLLEKTALCYELMAFDQLNNGDSQIAKTYFIKAVENYESVLKSFKYDWNDEYNKHRLLCLSELKKIKKSIEEKELEVKLKKILTGVGNYCEKLEAESIYFYCEEHVKENSYNQIKTGIKRNNYVYSYQLIESNDTFKETRNLLRNSGNRKRYDVRNRRDPWKSTSVIFKKIIFGPQGVFGFFWQPFFDYKIIGEDILDNEKTIIIEAIPKDPFKKKSKMKNNLLFGKAWIKSDGYEVLKIEWEPKSVGFLNDFQQFSKNRSSNLRLSLFTEYLFERNGVRYPTRGFYSEYLDKNSKKTTLLTLNVKYKKFKFFKVNTETEIGPVKIED